MSTVSRGWGPLTGLFQKEIHNPFGRLAVPQGGRSDRLGKTIEHLVSLARDSCRVSPDHTVGAVRYGDWTLRGISQSKAWHAKDGAFFLEAPGVSQNQAGPADEGDEV